MKHQEHRLGVSEVNLVTRHLGLQRPIHTEKLRAALAEIDELYGLDDIDLIEWTRFKEEYYLFVDQNVKDNVQHEPWSCHRVPTPSRK